MVAKIFKSKDVIVSSAPSSQFKKVVDIYVDNNTGKLVVIQEQ